MATSAGTRRFGRRAAALVVCAVGLYIVTPSLLTLFGAWPRLGDVKPWWFAIVVVLEAGSFTSLWLLLRVALPGSRWLDIATSQMAGNAASRVIPGGGAAGAVVQAHMLIRSGHPPGTVGAALSATALLTTGVVLALPVLTLPTVLLGPPLAHQLEVGLAVSLVVAALVVGLGVAVLTWDGLVARLAGAVGLLVHSVRRRTEPKAVATAVVAERDQVVVAFSGRWLRSLASAAGNRLLDYTALLASLYAVGAHASPALVLVAYVAAIALAFVPITPGGLGFVEAGLTTLLVLGGVTADQAIVGTLLYRLASYWLPIPVGALAWAGWRVHPLHRTAL